MRKKFLAGSGYFFSCYPDYKVHDTDYIVLNDDLKDDYWHYYDDAQKIDYFYYHWNTPEWHVNYLTRENAFGLDIAHLLVPEVAEELGITIEDLKKCECTFQPMQIQVGPFYNYYRVIYDSYIENNGFFLTDEQRLKAYQEYRKYHQENDWREHPIENY